MEVEHIIEIKSSKAFSVKGALASNDFIMRNLTRIVIYLENFCYIEKINLLEIAKDMNNYFLIELMCALSREYGNKNFLYCLKDYDNCPLECVWTEMKLK